MALVGVLSVQLLDHLFVRGAAAPAAAVAETTLSPNPTSSPRGPDPMQTTKTAADVEAAVRRFIADNYLFGAGPESIKDTDSFLDQGIINSMGVLELIAFLEYTYGIKVGDDEMVPENLDSVSWSPTTSGGSRASPATTAWGRRMRVERLLEASTPAATPTRWPWWQARPASPTPNWTRWPTDSPGLYGGEASGAATGWSSSWTTRSRPSPPCSPSSRPGPCSASVNPTTKADKLAYILNNCRAKAVVTQDRLLPVVAAAVDQAPSVDATVVVGAGGRAGRPGRRLASGTPSPTSRTPRRATPGSTRTWP